MALSGTWGSLVNARVGLLLLSAATAGCGSLNLAVPPEPRTSASSARATVEHGLQSWRAGYGGSVCLGCEVESVRVSNAAATIRIRRTRDDAPGATATVRVPFTAPVLEATSDMGVDWVIWMRATPSGGQGAWMRDYNAWLVKINRDEDAQRFIDAWGDLVALNRGSTDTELEFRGQAATWRAANPKPPLSDEGARHKVIAENAFREKNVDAAIEHFSAALETDPTWPNGNFNLALLLAETGDYALAARHMKRYLLLVPESKDAKVASDKIIVWEDKAGVR